MTGQSPEELQAQVEHQREQLAGTVDALSSKLDVKAQARTKVDDARRRATTETGAPRPELVVAAAAAVVVVALLVWKRRR